MKQSVVLSGGELNHFYRLASLDDSSTNDAAARRTAMHQQSQARYKNWGNTLEAQRTKKKTDRVRKLEAIERAQQLIDAEEQHYQEAQRRVVLDRANRLLWQDTHAVKNFHGGLLHASVLKEREAQIDLKQRKAAQRRVLDQTFHDAAEEDRIKAEEMSLIEAEKRAENARAAAAQQLQQLREVRVKQQEERLEQVAEGERIKRVAAAAIQESAAEDARRQEAARRYNAEYMRANDEQLLLKQAQVEHEMKEDARIVAFATEKERLVNLRRDHEAAKFAAKQQRIEKMLKAQFDHLSHIKEAEAQRTNQQIKEIEKRTDDRIAADKEKALQLKETIRLSRQAQLDRKERERLRKAENEAAMTREWQNRNREMEEAEWNEERATVENALRLQATLRQQMIVKEERARSEVNKEFEEARLMKEAREREDKVFEAYCTQQLEDLQLQGKSTLPLKVVLQHEKIKTTRLGNFAVKGFR